MQKALNSKLPRDPENNEFVKWFKPEEKIEYKEVRKK